MGAERSVDEIVAQLERLAERDRVSFGDIIAGIGARSFGAVLLVPALLVVSPLSGIPFFSSLCGLMIALIAVQMLLGRRHLWMPGWLQKRSMSGHRLAQATRRLHPIARWLDAHSGRHLGALLRPPLVGVPYALCMMCGLSMPFLELLPFSSSLLGAAVMLFSTAFLTREGGYLLGGLAFMALASLVPLVAMSLFGG